MEWFIVAVILIACLAYAAWHAYKLLANKNNPCAGCDGCPLSEQNRKKETCTKKK